jgi:SRSO17 transposase
MQLPIITPAPIVANQTAIFRDLFENKRQFRHFQNYLTGLTVLSNKSMANMARCILDSADKTNLSRFLSESDWSDEKVNDRRVAYLLERTQPVRKKSADSCLVLDDTLCEHVGSLFEYVDRHYNHGDNSYPLAHNLVTSHYVSGAVRFPVDLRQYRRYEEATQWEEFVHKHFPEREIPKSKKDHTKFHKEVDPQLLKDPEFQVLDSQFKTKIALGIELIKKAVERQLPFDTVLFDGWYLAPDLVVEIEAQHKHWISILKKNRKLETNSFTLKDAEGKPISLEGPHIQVEDLVSLIPVTAYQQIEINQKNYWCFSLAVRIPELGKVRIVISFENAALTGTYVTLVTNRADWRAAKIIQVYLQRWPIETFYQDGKQLLGLDEYRMRSAEAIRKHWCLVFVAYSLLHLDCLPAAPVQGLELPTKTIGEACRGQAQALIQALILHTHDLLEQDVKVQVIFENLFAKQTPLVSAIAV